MVVVFVAVVVVAEVVVGLVCVVVGVVVVVAVLAVAVGVVVVVAVVWRQFLAANAATVAAPWFRSARSVVLIVLGRLLTALPNDCEAFAAAPQSPELTAAPTWFRVFDSELA